MIFVGIDPGLTGAVAAIDSDAKVIGVYDTPILSVKKGKGVRHEFNRVAMVELLSGLNQSAKVAIERVNSMPGQGVASTFSFGVGFGIWLGIITALNMPLDLVHPTRWKKVMMDGMGKSKDADRIRAMELFGNQVDLSLKKHHGRADSLLIAEYRRRIG